MIKNILIGLGVALAIVLSVVALTAQPAQIVGKAGSTGPQGERGLTGPAGPQGPVGPRGPAGASARDVVGGLSSPNIQSDYLCVGGACSYFRHTDMSRGLNGLGTTTVCALQSPAATSSLSYFSFGIQTGTSTAAVLTLATSTSRFSTTTYLTSYTLGANQQLYAAFAPTTTQATSYAPNTYVVLGVQGNVNVNGSNNGFMFTGQCNGEFRSTF